MHGAIAKIARCRRFQPLASVPQPPESNREPLRLEIHLTLRKQTTACHSNRQKTPGFQITINPAASSTRRGGPSVPLAKNELSSAKKLATGSQTFKTFPRFLFRLEPTPTLCFHQLTENLNEPMFRLEKEVPRIPAPKNTRTSR